MEYAIANFRQTLRDNAAKLGLPAFWRWWRAELAPLVPAAARTAVQRFRLRPVVAFGDQVAVVWDLRLQGGALVLGEAARIPLSGDAAAAAHAGRAAIDALPRRAYDGAAASPKVIVALPGAQVLRKEITLPAAVEENLKEALAYDLDRHTPFRADQLYFDAVVIGRDLAKKEVRVDWAAALKPAVDQARRHAENWGATVVGVTPQTFDLASAATAAPAAWTKLNLLPEAERPDVDAWRRWQFWVPVALLGAMALAAVVLPVWQKRDHVIALTQVTERARVQAAASDALREQLDRAMGDYNFVLGKKYAFPSTVHLLDDVTRLLPDDTWLTQFELKSLPKGKEPQREMLLRGESGNAGHLIAALEDSKQFEQAAPRSPTTKIQPGPGEVFDLGAQVKPLPAPQPMPVVSAAPAAVPAGLPAEAAAVAPPAAVTAPANPQTAPGASTAAPTGSTPVVPSQPAAPAAVAPPAAAAAAPAPMGAGPVPAAGAPVPAGTAPVPVGAVPVPPGAPPAPAGAVPIPTGAVPIPTGASPAPAAAERPAPAAITSGGR